MLIGRKFNANAAFGQSFRIKILTITLIISFFGKLFGLFTEDSPITFLPNYIKTLKH